MSLGVLFIAAGVLIALFPPLLSMIVAFLLILVGGALCSISYRLKKGAKRFEDPFMDFFTKF
ncbi:MAG: hypothetical protein ABH885_08315 [Candidatus Omnitrophota bacterium]